MKHVHKSLLFNDLTLLIISDKVLYMDVNGDSTIFWDVFMLPGGKVFSLPRTMNK